jgi:RNA polymerase sigma-70 factor (ECF subfamily)
MPTSAGEGVTTNGPAGEGAPRQARSPGDDRVRRAQRGDVGAYESLYREHVGRVHALCLRVTGDRGLAAELTQDVFVRAWERLAQFRGESVFGTWLHRLTVNLVLEHARAESRRVRRVRFASELPADPATGAAPDPAAEYASAPSSPDERIDFERAVARLSPGARTVFVLHDVEGYKHGEIARLTGTAEGTLRAQLHTARRKMMEMLSR